MAITVSGKNYTQISSCDTSSSGGTWTVVTTPDTAQMKEGAASLSGVVKTAGDNIVMFTPTVSKDLSGTKHVRFWILLTHGGILNTYALDGLNFWASDGVNTGYWKVLGRDTYPGGWINCVIDVSKDCDSGTKPTSMNAITSMGVRINLTAAGKNAANTWIDNLCVCDGLVAYGDFDSTAITIDANSAGTFTRGSGSFVTDGIRAGMRIRTSGFTNAGNNGIFVVYSVEALVITVVDATGMVTESGGGDERVRGFFELDDIFNADDATTLGIGILRKIGGQYFAVGSLEIGDASGTGDTRCQFKSSVLVFEDRRVNDALYAINVVDNGTGTTEFIIGSKTGSSGLEGCMIRTQSITQTPKFTVDGATDADVDNFLIYGTTFYDAGVISFPPSGANVECLSCNFEAGANVVANTALIQNCNFVSSDAAGVKISSTSHQVTDCNFIGCSRGVLIDTYAASYTFDNLKFSACTYDVHNTSGSTIEVAKSNGSDPSTYDPAGDPVTFTGSIQLTITVKDEDNLPIEYAYAYIDDNNISPYIMNTQTNALGIATVGYTGGPVVGARWRVRLYGYRNFQMTLDIGGVNIDLPVTLAVDPQQT